MARRIVAFLDVLGFKAVVEKVPQPALLEIYRELQLAARAQTARPVFPDDYRRFDADAYYDDTEIGRERVVNVVMASDSIVVYSASDAYQDSLAVGAAVRGLLVAGFRNGLALRGALAVGELDEIDLEDDAVNGQTWTARFAGLVGLGLVRAYELEQQCNWGGAILHSELVAHLDATIVAEHEDGILTALDLCSSIQLFLETEVPVKDHGQVPIRHETRWAVHWPFVTDSPDWSTTEEEVANSFTSFDRTPLGADVETKRDETVAFMRRAGADGLATYERRMARASASRPHPRRG